MGNVARSRQLVYPETRQRCLQSLRRASFRGLPAAGHAVGSVPWEGWGVAEANGEAGWASLSSGTLTYMRSVRKVPAVLPVTASENR